MPNNINQQAVFLQSGDPNTENRVPDSYSPGQLGQKFTAIDPTDSNRAKRYQIVQADSVMDVAPAANLVAWWLDATSYLVTTDVSVAGRGNVAGVFRCAVDLGNIGCIQQGGLGNVEFQGSPTEAPTAAGLIVIPSATDGVADCLAAGTAATYPPLGKSKSAAASNVALVDLDLPGRP